MLTGIDHVVIVVPDLDAAVGDYQALGFSVVRGGRHTAIGSHNALISLADGAYLELIAFFEPTGTHRWRTKLDQGGGLVDYCLQTDDLHGDAATFRSAGVTLGEPWPLSRKRPDGYAVTWILATPGDAQSGYAPFLIEDMTPREERVPKHVPHANGVTGIATLTVAAPDVAPVRGWLSAVLGEPGEDIRRPDVSGRGVRFTIGPHMLDFVAPDGGAGPLAAWIAARGPSPYSLTLETSGKTGPLDERRAAGARVTLV